MFFCLSFTLYVFKVHVWSCISTFYYQKYFIVLDISHLINEHWIQFLRVDFVCSFCCSFTLGIYLEVKLLSYVIICFTFWRTVRLFSRTTEPFYIPISFMSVPISPPTHQHLSPTPKSSPQATFTDLRKRGRREGERKGWKAGGENMDPCCCHKPPTGDSTCNLLLVFKMTFQPTKQPGQANLSFWWL